MKVDLHRIENFQPAEIDAIFSNRRSNLTIKKLELPLLVFGVGDRVLHLLGGTMGRRRGGSLSDCVESVPPIMMTSSGVAGDGE